MSSTISKGRLAVVTAFSLLMLHATTVFGQEEVLDEQVAAGLAFRFWIIIVAVIIAWLSRAVLLRRLNKLMVTKSDEADSDSGDEIQSAEEPAQRELRVAELTVNSERPELAPATENLLRQARASINRTLIVNLIIGAVYVAGYHLILDGDYEIAELIHSVTEENVEFVRSSIVMINLHWQLIIAFLLWNVMRFLGDRNRVSASGMGALGFLKPIASFFLGFFHSYWCQAIGVILLLDTIFVAIFFFKSLMLVPVAIHLFLWYWLKRDGRKHINSKLLILRVFFLGKTSAFTFKKLTKCWQHFGTYFTVADPAFFKVSWKQRFNYTFPLYILLLFFIYTQLTDDNKDIEGELFIGFVFLFLVGSMIYVAVSRSRIKRDFMTTTADLNNRMSKLDRAPTRYDQTFKDLSVMCYDNNWKNAVDGLIDSADVILMDLRGFSEANKGCSYEVNVLFDRVPVERVVFMGYEDATPLIRQVIEEQWKDLSITSPNLNNEDPATTLYTVTKEGGKDVQGILDLLLRSAAASAQRA